MKITVITVCFNSAQTIADTLRSVAGQDYPDVEHIVVDGASTDGTLEVIRSSPNRIAHLVSEPDTGIYDAMNKGLALASGDVVGFLNSDDIYADSSVLSRVAAACVSEEVDGCYSDICFTSAADPDRIVRFWQAGEMRPGRMAIGWMPPHPTFYVRRHLYQTWGGFDPGFRLQGDFEMAIRLVEVAKIRLRYLPEPLVRMRMGGASNASLRNIWRGNVEAYRAARRHGLVKSPWFMVRKVASRIPQFFARPPR